MTASTSTSTALELPTPGLYAVDAVHSSIGFTVRHLVAAKVRGSFTEFSGQITVGESAAMSSVTATVQANSISTANEMRDGHLKSQDFLDQENFPTLDLVSKSITEKSPGNYALVADLTVRGVTRSVTFNLEYLGTGASMTGGRVAGFEATAEIDRRDFGVSFQGTLEDGALVVGNKVNLEFAIEAHLQA
jgi:polyisoprenoid-binding protein YceI